MFSYCTQGIRRLDTDRRGTNSKDLQLQLPARCRKKLSCEDAEDGKQGTKNAKGFSDSWARQTALEEEMVRSEHTATDDVDFMQKFAQLADRYSHQAQSRPSTPSESEADPSSDEESQPDPSSDEEEEFSLPKKTVKPTARSTPSPVDLRHSFAALTDNEEEQETTPALL